MAVVINKQEEDLFQWCCQQLHDILDLDSPQDIVQYLLTMSKELDVVDYLNDLLDETNSKHNAFIGELIRKWRTLHSINDNNLETMMQNAKINNHSGPSNFDIPENITMYRKPAEENSFISSSSSSTKGNKDRKDQREKKPGEFKKVDLSLLRHEPKMPGDDKKSEFDQMLKSYTKPQGARKKQKQQQKFVPLYSNEGEAKDTIHLSGRHVCECQAQKHTLINNCLVCGRVVCAQEGSGPCLFCGNLVCTREEQEILSRNSNKSEKMRKKLMGEKQVSHNTDKQQTAIDNAIKNKNRLLEYDRTSVKRTQVIDDESDYFATDSNSWLSDKERELLRKRESELREQRHGSRLNKKITLDFAGRRVVDSAESVNMYDRDDAVVKAVNFGTSLQNGMHSKDLVNPTLTTQPPKFVSQVKPPKPSATMLNVEPSRSKRRIQDRELQEMTDDGMCLSMHQPWASLFVQGIKKHEGRTWYTAHRGRLWIAATAKMPSREEISELESFYTDFYEGIELPFPDSYPSACLLGCLDVVDCLSQDQYRVNFPDGESSSPFVIIAENFQELVVRFPIKGKHKIWKLTNDIHTGAKKGLRSVPKIQTTN